MLTLVVLVIGLAVSGLGEQLCRLAWRMADRRKENT
jgi:hypothetical protein